MSEQEIVLLKARGETRDRTCPNTKDRTFQYAMRHEIARVRAEYRTSSFAVGHEIARVRAEYRTSSEYAVGHELARVRADYRTAPGVRG